MLFISRSGSSQSKSQLHASGHIPRGPHQRAADAVKKEVAVSIVHLCRGLCAKLDQKLIGLERALEVHHPQDH